MEIYTQDFTAMIFISVLLGLVNLSHIVILCSSPSSCCQQNLKCLVLPLGTDHYFLLGWGRGVAIFGTYRQFFSKSNAFQTIFFITFCNENNFYDHF